MKLAVDKNLSEIEFHLTCEFITDHLYLSLNKPNRFCRYMLQNYFLVYINEIVLARGTYFFFNFFKDLFLGHGSIYLIN